MAEQLKYEIAHDLLAKQVFARFSADEKTLRKAERMLGDSYELHTGLEERGEGSRLLNREELIFLKPYIKQIKPAPVLLDYLELSDKVATEAEHAETRRLEAEILRQQQEQERQRKWLIAAVGAGLAMLAIAIFAGISYKKANDSQLALQNREDSIKTAYANLQQANIEVERQKDRALSNEQQALQQKRRADTLRGISDAARTLAENRLISLQEAQRQVLARERQVIAEKNRADSNRVEAEKAKDLSEARFVSLGEAQLRELTKLRNEIFQLEYNQGVNSILDATKLGLFDPKVRVGLLELAYYFNEADQTDIRDSIMEQVAFLDGTSRGGDAIPNLKLDNIEDLAGQSLSEEWSSRYFPSMISVKGGAFHMGSSDDPADIDCQLVELNDFEMSQYEVTVYQFELFLRAEGDALENLSEPSWGWQGDNPMTYVSWFDAIRYCNWLSRKMDLTEVYQIEGNRVTANWEADGYRLPTEAEWEYAAIGGRSGLNVSGFKKQSYAGSNDPNSVAWYELNSDIFSGIPRALPVGQKQKNELGFYDMSGNVWEWCFDWYGAYASNLVQNPKGLSEGNHRVARGGSWSFDAEVSKVDYRARYSPDLNYDDLGFRVVRSL